MRTEQPTKCFQSLQNLLVKLVLVQQEFITDPSKAVNLFSLLFLLVSVSLLSLPYVRAYNIYICIGC